MKRCFLIICIIMVLTACSNDKIDKKNSHTDNVINNNNVDNNNISDGLINNTNNDKINNAEDEAITQFKGILSSANTPELGNSSSTLNNNGYICSYNETLFFRNVNGDEYLYKKDKSGEKICLIEKKAFSINVLDDYIYFISDDHNNAICRIDIDGGNFTILSEDTSYLLLVTNDCIYYTDEEGHLYQLSLDGKELKNISDEYCAWINVYRDYIIYSSFADNLQIRGVNINTGETVQIADYGLSPSVYEDRLYFQDKSGSIDTIDLISGERLDYINKWGQKISPTRNGIYFSNEIDVFFYNNSSKEVETIPIASPDPRYEIDTHTNVKLIHCDEKAIYYILEINDKVNLVCLNIETGELYSLSFED